MPTPPLSPSPASPAAPVATGILLILAAHIAFVGMDVAMKALSNDLPTVQILFAFFAGFALVAIVRAVSGAGLRTTFATGRLGLHLARALLLPINIGCVIVALAALPMAETQALGLTFPLMVTALSAPLLGERVGPVGWAAVGIGFLGVLVIVRPGLAVFQPESLVILLGAAAFALYQILTRLLSRTESSTRLMLYTALVGIALLCGPALILWEAPDARGWRLLAMVSGCGVLGHMLVILALQTAPASLLQPFNFVQLIWATAAGYLVFGDVPDRFTVLGGAVIVSAGLTVWWRERVAGRRAARMRTAVAASGGSLP